MQILIKGPGYFKDKIKNTLLRFKTFWFESTAKDKVLAVITITAALSFVVFFILAITGKIGLLIVKSASMEPCMPPGSLVVFSAIDINRVDKGEVVVFRDGLSSSTLVTHRVIKKIKNDGQILLKTKGDNNKHLDFLKVDSSVFMGRVECIVPFAGRLMAFIKTPVGLLVINLLLILLIMLIAVDKLKQSIRVLLDAEGGDVVEKESYNQGLIDPEKHDDSHAAI